MPSPIFSSSTSAVAPTYIQNLDALIAGTKWGGAPGTGVTLSYSFPWATGYFATFTGPGGIYSSLSEQNSNYVYGLNTAQQSATRTALQTWANVANIRFQEVADTSTNVGDIRIAFTSTSNQIAGSGQAWGWTYWPNANLPSAGDIWISAFGSGSTNSDWSVGSYNYFSLIHEMGHALGLKHPFEAPTLLPALLDNNQYSVMAYNPPANDLFRTITYALFTASSLVWHVPAETPMVLDIAAIQYMYGANYTFHTGNDVYSFNPATPFFKTIWDAGGNDTISVSNFTENCKIDLTPGHYSSIRILSAPIAAGYSFPSTTVPTYDGTNNLGIAYGAIIENAIGGSGNDILIGNSANNTLTGGAGNDTIDGGAGIDTASYLDVYAHFTITPTGGNFSISDKVGLNGIDTLSNIERLKFSDTNLALDITNGNAGLTAKILGGVFGTTSLSNKAYVGIGLNHLDGGMSYQNLILLALNAQLGANYSNAAEVNLLYQNLAGILPSTTDLNYWVATITSGQHTQASLAIFAADSSLNTNNIHLAGLALTGIQYI